MRCPELGGNETARVHNACGWSGLAVRAQQPATPVIGFLNSGSPGPYQHLVAGFQKGLKETGYVEGENVVIEYRWAEGRYDRLAEMAADLVRRQVNVIAAIDTLAALAAEASKTQIPIVFVTAGDPVRLGLVVSLNRPGRNITGITQLGSELVSKRLGLLRDLIPTATTIGLLVNPTDPRSKTQIKDMQEAARALGLQIHILNASTEPEINSAFAKSAELRIGALIVGKPNPYPTISSTAKATLSFWVKAAPGSKSALAIAEGLTSAIVARKSKARADVR
jgi:ABC-type uncharacterized transport system substrate-binding protein